MTRNFLLTISAAALAVLLPVTPATAADVGVSVNVGQPGFFGRIDIGNVRPPVIYAEPMVIAPPRAVMQSPIYLRVPPGHAKNWARHCGEYNACAQRTYFVQENWYRNEYAPSRGYRRDVRHYGPAPVYRAAPHRYEGHGRDHGHGRGHGKDH
jgi:hypothetical protein